MVAWDMLPDAICDRIEGDDCYNSLASFCGRVNKAGLRYSRPS